MVLRLPFLRCFGFLAMGGRYYGNEVLSNSHLLPGGCRGGRVLRRTGNSAFAKNNAFSESAAEKTTVPPAHGAPDAPQSTLRLPPPPPASHSPRARLPPRKPPANLSPTCKVPVAAARRISSKF